MIRVNGAEALYRAVGANIRVLRERRHLTQEGLGLLLGCSHEAAQSIGYRLENGKRKIRIEDLYRIAEELGVDPRNLLPEQIAPPSHAGMDAFRLAQAGRGIE